MEVVTGVASSVVAKILEYPVRLIGRHLGYLIYYPTNKKSLTDRKPELDDKIRGVQRRAESARRSGKEIEECVTRWISEAESKAQEAEVVIGDLNRGHENTKCSCNGSFPNLVSRYKLSKKAKLMAEDIMDHIERPDKFKNFFYRPHLQPSFKNKDYEAFDTRNQTLKEIMEALRDPNPTMIGVYGMGGIGKTTLVEEVAHQAKEECFSDVVMVTVSQDFDLKSIQNKIAEGLDLTLDGENISVRAKWLKNRLRQGNKILIILDDIWKELDLSKAGINFNADDQRGCKILLVSRVRDVLCNEMGVTKIIEVKVLSDSEALGLFNKFVGDIADNSDFKELANQVVGECGGLPIAIVTTACSLKDKDLDVWNDFLSRLKSSLGMEGKVSSSIKMSYDFLESEEEKKVLLLCSLRGEDQNVDVKDLMFYGIGLGLFRGVQTMEDAKRRAHSLVDKLKAHCLLLDGGVSYDGHGRVKMHDVIRDVMISIANEDEHMHCLTKVADLEDGDFRESKAIVLLGSDFNNQLPPSLVCPNLQLLLAFDSYDDLSLETIPDDFFKEAQELKALSFDCEPLQSLPQSFCTLRHLRALRLQLGKNEDLTLIGELRNLIALDLSRSTFSQLPEHIGKLTRLRSLNLSGCYSLEVIQPNAISSLVRLEELYMYGVNIDWEVEGRVGEGRNASLMEVKNLRDLTTLHLNVRDVNVLPKDMFSENLQCYRIKIGSIKGYTSFTGSRLLYLNLRESTQLYQYGIQKLMKKSEGMRLEGFNGVDNIVYESDGFPQLKNFCLENDDEVRYIVHSTEEIQPCSAFKNLETLNLENLRNLEKICYGNVTMESFGKLRSINVRKCDKLKNLFSFSIARKFEVIEVSECSNMETLIYHGSEDAAHGNINNEVSSEKLEFPQLRSLNLNSLLNLIFFSSGLEKTCCSSLSDSPQPLFGEKVVFPSLKELKLFRMNFREIWSTTSCMQNLRELHVSNCPNLKYLFTVAMAGRLEQLEKLSINGCPVMEEVVVTNEHREERLEKLFPKLKSLELKDLRNLKRFCIGDCIECPSLLQLTIENCGVLRMFISINEEEVGGSFFNEKVVFPSLKVLQLSTMNFIELWSTISCMQNLRELRVSNCPNLKYLFTVAMAGRLEQLEKLNINGCPVMEKVLVTNEHGEERLEKLFPKLKSLELKDLRNLKRLCTGDCIECPSLLKLTIENCGVLRMFTSINEEEVGGPFFNEKVVFPSLKELKLSGTNFRELWSTTSCMQKYLSSLCVSDCPNLKYLFTVAMAGRFEQLETLEIRGCPDMEGVVVTNEHREGRLEKILFPKLKSLELEDLPNLKRFCTGDCIEYPSLLKLEIKNCGVLRKFISSNEEEVEGPFFNEKVSFPILEYLRLSRMNLKILWADQLPITSFGMQNLKRLYVSSCDSLSHLFSLDVARSLLQLEELQLWHCKDMEEVLVTKEPIEEGTPQKISFSKLKKLELSGENIRRFCAGCCIEFPSLTNMKIEKNREMRTFITDSCNGAPGELMGSEARQPLFNGKVAFPKLEELDVSGLDSVNSLFSLAVAKSLVTLKKLEVSSCSLMEEIVQVNEQGEEGRLDKISFPKLECIYFYGGLSNLKRFYEKSEELMGSEAKQPLLNGKVAFPKLEALYVYQVNSVNSLFSFAVAKSLVTLKSLRVSGCSLMEEIVQVNEQGEEGRLDKISFPKLESIDFYGLSNLKRFYEKSEELMGSEAKQPLFNGKVAFPKLEALNVYEMNSVNSLFSFAVAKSLVTLKSLRVSGCSLMEEIVQVNEQGEEGRLDKISFPKLESIDFYGLSNLKRFYGGACIEFPSLLKLEMRANKEIEEKMDIVVAEQHLVFNEVLGPNLEVLRTSSSKLIKEMCNCQSSRAPPFYNLKDAQLKCFRNEPIGFSLKCIQRYQNLESLSLGGFFVDTTHHHHQLMVSSEEHERPLKHLKKLGLFRLFMLTHLHEDSEDSENGSLENLKFLLIQECSRLKSPLLSSTTSFQNLMALVVSKCSAMINLLASSTAKTLVHLRFMSITECKQMTEIIAGEIVDVEIVFGKLEMLELSDLPSLRSFHSAGNSVMRFPNLVMLVVNQCPEMRRFSFGTIDAPKLDSISKIEKVKYRWDLLWLHISKFDSEMFPLPKPQQKLWEGDINKTLEKLWEEDDYSLAMQRLFTDT